MPGRGVMAVPVELVGHRTKDAIQLSAPEQRFGEYLVIPEGLYAHRPGSASVFRVLVVNEGEMPLLLNAGLPLAGELVKPDILEVSDEPPPRLHSFQEPAEPPDMQQLWEDLEMEENEFLHKDPLLRKEVWTSSPTLPRAAPTS